MTTGRSLLVGVDVGGTFTDLVLVDEASGEAGPPERVEQSWIAWQVHRALSDLPDQERQLIELAYWSGLSQSEIAEFLNMPLGTVKTRTRSALAHLADMLEGELA